MFTVEKANKFIRELAVLKDDVFRPKYHFTPKCGWCNDPHGITYFNGKFHMFFQYHPYEPWPKEMHWGHVTTEDFIHFDEVRAAIAPNMPYDNSGCWSGSVIVKNEKIYAYYTGFALHDDGKYYQTICLAISEDGEHFVKYENNPVIGMEQIPEFANIYDFRDPCVFFEGDDLYLIVGTKNDKEAMTLLYHSKDMLHFDFVKVLAKSSDYGTMFECPNLIRHNNHNYLVVSPQNIKMKDDNFFNVSSCIYFPLPKDLVREDAEVKNVKEIDHGMEYYAPNVYDKEKILVSWFQMWGRRYYLAEIGRPYCNSFSLFRKIVEDGDELKFIPLPQYRDLFENKEEIECDLISPIVKTYGKQFHLDLEVEVKPNLMFVLELTKIGEEALKVMLDVNNERIIIDRTNLKEQLGGVDNTPATKGMRWLKLKSLDKTFKFDIYVDSELIEIYVNDYKDSFNVMSFSQGDDIALISNMKTKIKMIKHDVVVK